MTIKVYGTLKTKVILSCEAEDLTEAVDALEVTVDPAKAEIVESETVEFEVTDCR
jgi:hypothetical protein